MTGKTLQYKLVGMGKPLKKFLGVLRHPRDLRGPAAIVFISRDTCSDSIAKLFRACFYGVSHNYRTICSHRCACVELSTKGGVSHHFGGVLNSLKKYRAIGALQKGPPFHGSRSSREITIQNASCQMGGSRSYKVINIACFCAGK